MWATTLWNQPDRWLPWGVALAASLLAATIDFRQHRIPNWLTGPLFLSGLIYAAGVAGWTGLTESLAATVIVALPYVLLFVLAGGGAGDAKLMGALGAWLGLVSGALVLVTVALAGGVIALAFALVRGQLRATWQNLASLTAGLAYLAVGGGTLGWRALAMPQAPRSQPIPYGVAIFAGVLLAAGGVFLWRI